MYRFEVKQCPASDLCDCCKGVPPECCPLKKAILAVGKGQAIDFLKILDVRVAKGTI